VSVWSVAEEVTGLGKSRTRVIIWKLSGPVQRQLQRTTEILQREGVLMETPKIPGYASLYCSGLEILRLRPCHAQRDVSMAISYRSPQLTMDIHHRYVYPPNDP
jgi:hypothetical protein